MIPGEVPQALSMSGDAKNIGCSLGKSSFCLEEVLFMTPDVTPSMRKGFVFVLCLSDQTWFS